MSAVYYPAAFATEAARNLRHLAADSELQATGPGTATLLGDLRDAATAMREAIDRIAVAHTLPGAPALARDTGRRSVTSSIRPAPHWRRPRPA
ncbi:hypothetical protein IOD13_11945 [Brevibacterium casei]|nr:hypothetical protein [Brevibacterium casei]